MNKNKKLNKLQIDCWKISKTVIIGLRKLWYLYNCLFWPGRTIALLRSLSLHTSSCLVHWMGATLLAWNRLAPVFSINDISSSVLYGLQLFRCPETF